MQNYFFKSKKDWLIIILFIVIIVFSARLVSLRDNYNKIVDNNLVIQEVDGVKYRVVVGEAPSYDIVIGDIIGIDKISYNFVDNINLSSKESLVLISGVKKEYQEVNRENFFNLISNDNSVLITDNFCLNNWPSKTNQEIYKNSKLNRGVFCGSESEVKIIDNLIKQYHPKKIDLYYSNEVYKELLQGFLLYLDELDIRYKLIKIK